jgi:hypothetical protein
MSAMLASTTLNSARAASHDISNSIATTIRFMTPPPKRPLRVVMHVTKCT